jgi:hypothetical protein
MPAAVLHDEARTDVFDGPEWRERRGVFGVIDVTALAAT